MRVVFSFATWQYVRETLPVVAACTQEGHHVTALIGFDPNADEATTLLTEAGADVRMLPPQYRYGGRAVGQKAADPARRERLRSWAARLPALRSLRLAAMARRTSKIVDRMLDELRPDIVALGPTRSCLAFDDVLRVNAIRRGLPCVAVAFSPLISRLSAVNARFDNLASGMLPQTLVFRALSPFHWRVRAATPKATEERDGLRLFMHDPVLLLAARLSGYHEADPWQQPSPELDRFYVFTEHARRLAVLGGYPPERVEVAGWPRLDEVIRKLAAPGYRREALAALGFAPDARFIIWNIEPAWEHHYASEEEHWRRVQFLYEQLKRLDRPVAIPLHPLCLPADYAFLEADPRFRISRRHSIHYLYPLSEFVVSHTCSTNTLADIFGKPLVVCDWQGISGRRDLEFRTPNAIIAQTRPEIAAAIVALGDKVPALRGSLVEGETPPLASAHIVRSMYDLVAARRGRTAALHEA